MAPHFSLWDSRALQCANGRLLPPNKLPATSGECPPCLTGLNIPTASSSLWVSSSIRRMSSIVRSIHRSIQQKSCRWKLVNILFSCFKKNEKAALGPSPTGAPLPPKEGGNHAKLEGRLARDSILSAPLESLVDTPLFPR